MLINYLKKQNVTSITIDITTNHSEAEHPLHVMSMALNAKK